MLEAKQFFCLLLAVSILRTKDIYGAHQRRIHANRAVDVKDKIIEVQCYAKCLKPSTENRHDCERKCRTEMTKAPRPGKCPSIILSNHIGACIDACQYDFDCPETQKCCPSTCGPVCQDAIGLDKDPTLPPIPKIVGFKLPKGQRVCEVTIQASANSVYAYHVEARQHVGSLFSARKLGNWQWQSGEKIAEISENKTRRTGISFKLKPGRWYQFRVAAVNANGFRGYTEPSKPFALSNQNIRADPKPPKSPPDLQVLSSRILPNGLMSLRVAWCPAKSDLPIEKYRVIWALYVRSNDDSLIANETFVKDATQFEITRLLVDSCYYIQVQAITISGRRRLKSEKVSLLFNTTMPLVQNGKLQCSNHKSSKETITAANNMLEDPTSHIKNSSKYDVKFRPSKKFGMIVQISGFHPHQKGRLIEICAGEFNCENREYGAIRPKDYIEYGKLKFNTTYTIRTVDLQGSGKTSENEVNSSRAQFTTPKCENWHQRFPKIHVEC
ncbi:anosmin-1 isoform X2 [Eupeodes corollae]|uniref:anosmin-1 isoform X2 n=1 Tax=Eupeodes corollae TaxID=290404 RepID=UPI002492934A|nr:anosmin-1 isoform X2 [Eupeodes corollae]